MDPDVVWKLLVTSLVNGHALSAAEYAENLAGWIAHGGYKPKLMLEAATHGADRGWGL